MSCFPCFSENGEEYADHSSQVQAETENTVNQNDNTKPSKFGSINKHEANGNIEMQAFTFRELATATKNFRPDCLLGEGGFGRVYKGYFESKGQVVAVKQLDRNGLQGNKEFTVEVLMLSHLHHPNLVNLIGYCADDLKPDKKPLKWHTRMKIAYGAAQGLEYLHEKANPPVIYRDLKSSNILLDEDYSSKLSDFGLAKLGPVGDKFNVASCVMGTYGYCAPEYAKNGELTLRSDVYSFGVVLLELISGRRVIDTTRPTNEQNLVAWAQPMFKDQKKFQELVDPLLNGAYPVIGLNQAVGVAAMCLQEEASVRPFMVDVVIALGFLTEERTPYNPPEPMVIDSSRHLERLQQVNQRSSSALTKQSSQSQNESSCSSSMRSVHSEDSCRDFNELCFRHSESTQKQGKIQLGDEESDRSSTPSSSSNRRQEESEQVIDFL